MRLFSAHRQSSTPAPRRRGFFRSAIFALACIAGVGFSGGEDFKARAGDDGGMMSFLLSGNGGRVRAPAPSFRFDPPAVRQQATFARKVATSRAKVQARAARLALAHQRARKHEQAGIADARSVAAKGLVQVAVGPSEQKTVAQTLALKAAAAAARPEDTHLRDKTLRAGDIVATTAGLRVFLGSEQFPYKSRDFVPVTSARHVAQRSDLEALDRALRGVRVAAAPIQKRAARVAEAKAAKPALAAETDARKPQPQTVALAYAPKAEPAASAGQAPAVRAIERVVRRVDAAPAQRAAQNVIPVATIEAPSEKRSE